MNNLQAGLKVLQFLHTAQTQPPLLNTSSASQRYWNKYVLRNLSGTFPSSSSSKKYYTFLLHPKSSNVQISSDYNSLSTFLRHQSPGSSPTHKSSNLDCSSPKFILILRNFPFPPHLQSFDISLHRCLLTSANFWTPFLKVGIVRPCRTTFQTHHLYGDHS